jgi:hypothetical protein
MNGAVAYAGMVKAERSDLISRYYDSQSILLPPPLWDNGEERPAYLITANALVWRPALAEIGGFNEHFPSAGGEDIDLGLRLWSVGSLSYAPLAEVLHTFEPKLCAFMRRFVRYGRGNRRLAACYQTDLAPHPFVPHNPSPINWLFASLQFLALWWGYHTAAPVRGWSVPLSTTTWSTASLEVVSAPMEHSSPQNSSEVSI